MGKIGSYYLLPTTKTVLNFEQNRWSPLLPGYQLLTGSGLDRATLVKFMHKTYQELYPEAAFSHLADTVEQHLSKATPLWLVEYLDPNQEQPIQNPKSKIQNPQVACLWLGNAVDQVKGDRHTHIFLLYVAPEHRRQGIGTALMRHAEAWARARGDRQISLQVFCTNQPAVNLYQQLGYQTQSLWMVKSL
jgi:ribosomal protein S18 acetylase RimI-like enzyme